MAEPNMLENKLFGLVSKFGSFRSKKKLIHVSWNMMNWNFCSWFFNFMYQSIQVYHLGIINDPAFSLYDKHIEDAIA